ncbi:tyrosine-type recombinase/integrase [Microbacterium sp.]|uniref:site-specific integrase n=1 Tax=Microbacterium sp. TaxID=51671 RepID=UPI0028110D5A|nr:tyrosine-type recombinase/integrase [Microbacterium sp.]
MAEKRGRTREGTPNGEPKPFWNASRAKWELRVTLPADESGKRRRKVIRDRTSALVVKKRNALLRELEERGDLPTRDMTIKEYAERWLEEQREGDRRAKTWIEYESVTRRYIVPDLGHWALAALQPATVSRWLARISRTPKTSGKGAGVERVSVHVVKSARKVLSAMLSSAEHEGLIARNVAQKAIMPSDAHVNAPRDALTVDEARDVLARLSRSGDPLWTLWAAAMLSGMRAAELAGLRRVDVTPDAVHVVNQLQRFPYMHGCGGTCGMKRAHACPQARIRKPRGLAVEQIHGGLCLVGYTKTQAGTRTIPNYAPLRAVLDHQIQRGVSESGLLWERDGKPIDPNDFSKLWNQLEPTLQIDKHIVPHAMRNTAAGLMFTAGVPEHVILNVLGHTELAMSRSYARQDLRAQADALEAITRMLEPAPTRA